MSGRPTPEGTPEPTPAPSPDPTAESSPEPTAESTPEPVRGLLLTHGKMAEGVVDAVGRITGIDDALVPLSNEGESPETLARRVDEILGEATAIVFTDLCTGSCALTARLTCRGRGRRTVVFGVNLPMLLDFVFQRHLALEELVPRLLEKGRQGVQALDPSSPT